MAHALARPGRAQRLAAPGSEPWEQTRHTHRVLVPASLGNAPPSADVPSVVQPVLSPPRDWCQQAGRRVGVRAQEAPRSPIARPELGGACTDGSQAWLGSALCTSPVPHLSRHPPGFLLWGQDSPQAGPSAWVSRPHQRALAMENQGLVWLSHHQRRQLTNGLRLSLPGCKSHREGEIPGSGWVPHKSQPSQQPVAQSGSHTLC